MRSRFVLLVVAILLIAGFAALNWGEIIRPTSVWFGPFMADAPLGAILLGLLALAVVVFALSAASMRTQTLLESRHHYKELEAQRLLADKAEASRFTELRTHIDTHQAEMRTQLEQMNRTLSARLTDLETRLDTRFDRMGYSPARPGPANPAPVLTDTVHSEPQREHALARENEARHAQMREEERVREQRVRDERELRREERTTRPEDRPTESSGWRRWF